MPQQEGLLRQQFHCRSFLLDYPCRLDFVRSQWPFHQHIFLAYRILLALYCLAIIIASGFDIPDGESPLKWFIFVTDWAYTFLTAHFLWSAGTTLHYTIATANGNFHENEDEVEKLPLPWYYRGQWVLHNITITMSILVSIFYWALVFDPDRQVNRFIDINLHAINGVFALVDVFMTSVPTRLMHFYQPVIFAVTYGIFTVIYWAAGGKGYGGTDFIYEVLDFSETPGTAALYIVLISLVAVPIFHLLIFGLYALRLQIAKRCCGVKVTDCEESEMRRV